jgi:hypothetical protein
MARWDVNLYWHDDDSEDMDVDAETLEEALRMVYAEWHPTGWTHALVGGVDLDLEAATFDESNTYLDEGES